MLREVLPEIPQRLELSLVFFSGSADVILCERGVPKRPAYQLQTLFRAARPRVTPRRGSGVDGTVGDMNARGVAHRTAGQIHDGLTVILLGYT